ncbi:putative oligomerization/nucleic acid binding protein [Cytobacillus horneckiae]
MGFFNKKPKENFVDRVDVNAVSGMASLLGKKYANNNELVSFKKRDDGVIKISLTLKKLGEFKIKSIEWEFSESRSGKKMAGGAIAGTLIAGPLGTIAGAGLASGKKENSTANIAVYDVENNRDAYFIVKCNGDQYTKLLSWASPDYTQEKSNVIDPVTEIRKYKELLDEGLITQEEFDKKKSELL